MPLTNEQQAVLDYVKDKLKSNSTNNIILVSANAGSGKTHLLKSITQELEDTRCLYIVYNKSMQEEARNKGFYNTDIHTIHGLAYRYMKGKLGYIDLNPLNFNELNPGMKHLGKAWNKYSFYGAKSLLDKYYLTVGVDLDDFISSYFHDLVIEYEELRLLNATNRATGKDKKRMRYIFAQIKNSKSIEKVARELQKLRDSGNIAITHDYYLKLFAEAIRNGDINLGEKYDILMLDECNDTNRLTRDIFTYANVKVKIGVGDMYQNINKHLDTVNLFTSFSRDEYKQFNLTKSFRCTKTVGKYVHLFRQRVYGKNAIPFEGVSEDTSDTSELWLSRTNAQLIESMIQLSRQGIPFNLTRDINYIFAPVLSLYAASLDEYDKLGDEYKFLEQDRKDFLKLVEDTDNKNMKFFTYLEEEYKDIHTELVSTIKLIYKLGLQSILEAYYHFKKTRHRDANITLSTVHSAKGLEAGKVVILADMDKVIGNILANKISDITEYNLAYVALSRAKHTIESNNLYKLR